MDDHPTRPLLDRKVFEPVFAGLRGKRIGYVRPHGNVGDLLIEVATEQLLDHFQIDWKDIETPDGRLPIEDSAAVPPPPDVDELIFGGGGNMGDVYPRNWNLRSWCLATGLPVTILPQSFLGPEPRAFRKVFVRERGSFRFCPDGELAPDLVLGLCPPRLDPPQQKLGVFLRRDVERFGPKPWRYQDPVRLCSDPIDYLRMAAKFEAIITDRLHFAICGLIAGRETVILPNSYHKNQSMFETWLEPLGCRFAQTAAEGKRILRAGWGQRVYATLFSRAS